MGQMVSYGGNHGRISSSGSAACWPSLPYGLPPDQKGPMSGSHSLVCPFIKKLPGFAFKRSRDILGTAPARAQDIGGKTRTLNIPHWQGKSRRWLENPYHQYFCGEEYFCHELPIDPSSLSRWRGRIGEQGSELILQVTVQAGLVSGAIKASSLERISIDTAVQEKAIAFPTDARLFNRSRERLVRLAKKHGVQLRQSYSRLGPRALMWVG